MAMQRIKKTRLEDRVGDVKSVLSEGNTFKGIVEAKDSLQIFGTIEGEVKCEKVVWVTPQGLIKGTINSKGVIIEGEVKGDIESAQWFELRESGKVTGNISADNIALAQGCFFEGEVKMTQKGDKPIEFKEKRTTGDRNDVT